LLSYEGKVHLIQPAKVPYFYGISVLDMKVSRKTTVSAGYLEDIIKKAASR